MVTNTREPLLSWQSRAWQWKRPIVAAILVLLAVGAIGFRMGRQPHGVPAVPTFAGHVTRLNEGLGGCVQFDRNGREVCSLFTVPQQMPAPRVGTRVRAALLEVTGDDTGVEMLALYPANGNLG